MEKIKLDQYIVYNKKREYRIIVFPKEPLMWGYEDSPYESDLYMVDGDKNAFKALSRAMALLANDFGKIVYFPLDGKGLGGYYTDSYKLVLCRPELQFRQSEWYDIKSQLNPKHYSGKYVLQYDKQKLKDLYERIDCNWKQRKSEQAIVRKVLGDTLFLTIPRYSCYQFHYNISKALEAYKKRYCSEWCGSLGWMIGERDIREMKQKEGILKVYVKKENIPKAK